LRGALRVTHVPALPRIDLENAVDATQPLTNAEQAESIGAPSSLACRSGIKAHPIVHDAHLNTALDPAGGDGEILGLGVFGHIDDQFIDRLKRRMRMSSSRGFGR